MLRMTIDQQPILLFTLFHHEVYHCNDSFYQTKHLSQLRSREIKSISVTDIADKIYKKAIKDLRDGNFVDKDISLTLTGGMDSRVILACLLKAGIKPNCFTFGTDNARDVYYASKLAKAFNLPYQNVVNRKPDKVWYYHWVKEVIKTDSGNSHLHRAHRLAAIDEHCKEYNPRILFTGHMGGEGIRGLTYNNYFASRFFEEVNEGKKSIRDSAESVLHEYFIRPEVINWDDLSEKINSLPYMSGDKEQNKFHFLYDLVANIHHAQDLRLYQSRVEKVVPVYLQKEYLKALFSSQNNFLSKPPGIFGKLQNPKVHTEMIAHLYPDLLDYPLSNGYKPSEYQKGLWYVVPRMLFRKRVHKQHFDPTFSYGDWYVEFVKEHSENISDAIWDIYDKDRYMKALNENVHKTDEGYWHKFSNPIFFDLVEKQKKGVLE